MRRPLGLIKRYDMKKIILLVIILFSFVFAQTDSLNCLSYFPMHIGDKFYYNVQWYIWSDDTTIHRGKVLVTIDQDTLMTNGHRYFVFNNLATNYNIFRIDSIDNTIYTYITDNYYGCTDSEIPIFRLSEPSEPYYTDTLCTDEILIQQKVMIHPICVEDSVLSLQCTMKGFTTFFYGLAYGLGISSWGWEEAGFYGATLYAAEIDGRIYGKINSIDPKLLFVSEPFLYPAYPNPFNSSTVIRFTIPNPDDVILNIFDISGKLLESIKLDIENSQDYNYLWDAQKYSTGIYLYQIKGSNFQQSRKCLLIK